MDFDASDLRSDQPQTQPEARADATTIVEQNPEASEHRERTRHQGSISRRMERGNDMACPMEATEVTTVSVCCTISLEAHEIYRRHSARRDGSSMVSAAILFYEQHGPLAKTGLPVQLALREKSIAFFQNEIRKLNAEIKAADGDSAAIGFDDDTGLFHFRD